MTKDVLVADNLQKISCVFHAFFLKSWGESCVSGSMLSNKALEARLEMANFLGVSSERFLFCRQIHSSTAVTIEDLWDAQKAPTADAMVTNIPGTALGILTADCVPVLFADPKAKIIGAAHAGWRGALDGVLKNTVAAMEKLGAKRENIHAALGPCIWTDSYEVGFDFPIPFLNESIENKRFFSQGSRENHHQFDLPGYVISKLQQEGLASIKGSPSNTYSNPECFFSHRYSTLQKTQRTGSLISAIALNLDAAP